MQNHITQTTSYSPEKKKGRQEGDEVPSEKIISTQNYAIQPTKQREDKVPRDHHFLTVSNKTIFVKLPCTLKLNFQEVTLLAISSVR